jgi:hypothetical protein
LLGKVKEGQAAEEENLLHAHDDEAHKKSKKKKEGLPVEEGQESDPLNYLGFGMIAYRDLMFTMFWLFALLSLIMLPAMTFYKGQGALNDDNKKGWAAPFSLGSFGYSSNQCQIAPFQLNEIPVHCQYGTLGQVISAGVIPQGE